MTSLRRAWCAIPILAAAAGPAQAQTPRLEPDDAELTQRLDWLARVLDREAAATKLWRESWITFYGAAILFESHLAATATSPAPRVGAAVNMGEATLAFGFTLLSPAHAEAFALRLRADGGETRAQRLARLHRAEALLADLAVEERDRRGWFGLIGGAAVAAGGGAVNWAATRGSSGLGWLGVATSMVVAQIQFHTQPTGAIRAWEAYRRAGAGARLGPPPAVLRWSIGSAPLGEGAGVGLRASF
jgi:hypothetical protein